MQIFSLCTLFQMPDISEYLVLLIMAGPQQQRVARLKAYSNKLKAEFILRYSQHSVFNTKLMLYSYIYIAIKKQTDSTPGPQEMGVRLAIAT